VGTVTSRRGGDGSEPLVRTDSPDDLLLLLVRTTKALVDRLRAGSPEGPGAGELTVVHGVAVRYLLDRDGATTVELARYLRVTKQSASEVVALLEHHGLVRRAPHPRDGRARLLLITDEGRRRVEDGHRRWQEVEDEWAAIVGREELDVVRGVLSAYLAATDPALSS
jgi:DNA-binding MarR family transcriptional regulator